MLPVFVVDDESEGAWRPAPPASWWRVRSLQALDTKLESAGATLVIRTGDTAAALRRLVEEVGATTVVCTGRPEPAALRQDARVRDALASVGVELFVIPDELFLSPPAAPQVFSHFHRSALQGGVGAPARSRAVRWARPGVPSERMSEVRWRPMGDGWVPGQPAGDQMIERVRRVSGTYAARRDLAASGSTTRLSPYLRSGDVSVRSAWAAAGTEGAAVQRELAWREFARALLRAHPDMPDRPIRREFERFPYAPDAAAQARWRAGETGYPLVDAAMRQLYQEGWIPNRLRMVVGSFLVKHLLQPWQDGERWFWDRLLDADLANNAMNWQWVAGSGVDAAPFFRIFNPTLQAEKFDPGGVYITRWVQELALLPAPWRHRPWEAPESVLAEAGVDLGRTYPRPIVDRATARARALDALAALRTAVRPH